MGNAVFYSYLYFRFQIADFCFEVVAVEFDQISLEKCKNAQNVNQFENFLVFFRRILNPKSTETKTLLNESK